MVCGAEAGWEGWGGEAAGTDGVGEGWCMCVCVCVW